MCDLESGSGSYCACLSGVSVPLVIWSGGISRFSMSGVIAGSGGGGGGAGVGWGVCCGVGVGVLAS